MTELHRRKAVIVRRAIANLKEKLEDPKGKATLADL